MVFILVLSPSSLMVFLAHPDVLTSVLLLLVLKPSPAYSLVSMLVYSTVSQVVPESGTETYINAVLCLSFMVGCLLTLLGICQLGIITSLLSETVVCS